MSSTTIGQGFNLGRAELAKALAGSAQASEKFIDAAQKSAQALFTLRVSEESAASKPSGDLNTPKLKQPDAKAQDELNGAGKLALLLGQLMALLGDVSLSQFESRLSIWQAMMDAQKAEGEQLSQELKSAQEEAEQATEAYQSAVGDLDKAKAVLDAAKQKLAQAQAKLEGMSPDDPAYAQALSECDQAQAEANRSQQKVDKAETEAMAAHKLATDKAKVLDNKLTQAQGMVGKNDAVQQGGIDSLSNTSKLTMLMAMFMQLVGKNSEESLKNDLELFKVIQESRQKEMDKKSAEYQEEVRKAEELNRIMGCVGKVLGALLTVVSVVAAAFTGGASLALAAVGIALMVADSIVKATTGESFIQKALDPLMENVFKPLMEGLGKFISEQLEKLGVDKKTADLVGSIVGAVVGALAMVGAMVVVAMVGKGAASKLAGAMSKLLGDTIKKIVPSVLKEVAKGGTKMFNQGMQRLTNALGDAGRSTGLRATEENLTREMVASALNRVAVGGQFAQTTSQGGGEIAQGVFLKNATELMADFTLARSELAQIEQWMKDAVEAFSERQQLTEELHKNIAIAGQQSLEAGRFVLQQTHA
ncbi:pathogenicity island 1 effector protein SipB [Chromobacterium amazonense]|uniref:Translocator protein BipB n=1 Tax=Chromobacterium amazonense TaxID=1382803 RepID=A0A2S9X5H4_9NEIS|nr:type III secretion system translocon subunit SctE [Chromobacterium amazonense]PRP70978.1 pathogenicity island 1 effector protein SipB [Chromobacterium amazonense]